MRNIYLTITLWIHFCLSDSKDIAGRFDSNEMYTNTQTYTHTPEHTHTHTHIHKPTTHTHTHTLPMVRNLVSNSSVIQFCRTDKIYTI